MRTAERTDVISVERYPLVVLGVVSADKRNVFDSAGAIGTAVYTPRPGVPPYVFFLVVL